MKTKILIILLSIIYISKSILIAQTLTVDGAEISITNEAILAVDGSALNKGEIYNHGSMAIAYNWDNQANYFPDNSFFILNGTTEQNISHNNQQIASLIIDGQGSKLLNGDIEVINKLTLTSGIIFSDINSKLILLNNSIVEGGSVNSYVEGPLFNMGINYKMFPIGKDGIYRPVEFINVYGDNPTIGIEAFNYNNNQNTVTGIENIISTVSWVKTNLNGIIDSTKVRLSFSYDDFIDDIERLVVIEADNNNSEYRIIGRASITGNTDFGTIESEKNITGNYFGLAYAIDIAENLLYIPNAFALNSQNSEENVFKIYGNKLTTNNFKFIVYNKWGNVVFRSNSLEQMQTDGWDGTNYKNSTQIGSGVYNFIIEGELINGEKFNDKGTIVVIK